MKIRLHHVLALLWLQSAGLAHAGLFDDAEARRRILEIETQQKDAQQKNEQRFRGLEEATRAQLQLSNQLQNLQQEVAKLRGQLEVLGYEIEQTQKRQKDLYVDLDSRLRKIETGANKSDEVSPNAAATKPSAEAETKDYEQALDAIKTGNYAKAAEAFANFIQTYPNSTFLPSAHFWQASALYQNKDYAAAAPLFSKVAATWPTDTRAPDALLGYANCQTALKAVNGARKTLETIVAQYPNSSAAKIAKQRLAKK